MKLLMTGLDLGLYKREKEEKPLEIYWSQDQGGYDTVSPKKKKSLLLVPTEKKINQVFKRYNDEDISIQ